MPEQQIGEIGNAIVTLYKLLRESDPSDAELYIRTQILRRGLVVYAQMIEMDLE